MPARARRCLAKYARTLRSRRSATLARPVITNALRKATTPTDRDVRCHRCVEPIERDTLALSALLTTPLGYKHVDRLGLVFDSTRNETRTAWFHLDCAVDVHRQDVIRLFSTRDAPPANIERLLQRALHRSSVDLPVEPARDPKGRPRVTVKVIGDAATENSDTWKELVVLCRDSAFASPRFEYVFDAPRHDQAVTYLEDRSRPIVASVLAVTVDTKLVKPQRDKLQAMFVAGFASPVLWVLGPADVTLRDKRVIELRAALEAIGFDGDDATALCTDQVDTAALEALVLALDERSLDTTRATPGQRFEALVDALERALSDRDEPAIATRAGSLSKSLKRNPIVGRPGEKSIEVDTSVQSRARVAAAKALSYVSARDGALDVLWHFRDARDADALEAMLDAMWTESGRTLSTAFNKAHGLLRTFSADRAAEALLRGFFHERVGKSRRKDIGSFLLGASRSTLARELRERAAARPKRDAVALEAEALAAVIERSQRAK